MYCGMFCKYRLSIFGRRDLHLFIFKLNILNRERRFILAIGFFRA